MMHNGTVVQKVDQTWHLWIWNSICRVKICTFYLVANTLQSYQTEFEEDFINQDIRLEQASAETNANKL